MPLTPFFYSQIEVKAMTLDEEDRKLLCAIGEGIRLLLEITVKGSFNEKEYVKVHQELIAALNDCANA